MGNNVQFEFKVGETWIVTKCEGEFSETKAYVYNYIIGLVMTLRECARQ